MAFAKLSLLLLPFLTLTAAQQLCNGYAALCDRSFSNVSQVGAHDSAFVGSLPQDNQDLSVTAQLDAGIRFLQAQAHKDPFGSLSLCHTSCFEEDAGPLSSYLSTIKTWMDGHPDEVLMLLLVNGDPSPIADYDAAFASSGIKPYTFIPASSPGVLNINAWPTLRQLIAANTRLVVFIDSGSDTNTYPYILDEFSYFFETPFDTTDPNFAECTLDRPAGASPAGRMYIVNHFLDVNIFGILVPDRLAADTTNGVASVGTQVGRCVGMYGTAPKGVLVDFMEKGDVFAAERAMNGV